MTSLAQNFLNPNNKPLVIGDFTIRQDEDGRYCLHDLHKASGALEKHQPAFFMRNKQTKDLIEEIENSVNLQSSENDRSANLQIAVKVIKGGAGEQGTYVVKELVYAYAMWISPKFHLMVIRAYDSLVMEWVLNGKQTISPEQAGVLYNIVHTRANGNKNLIVQMWSRLKSHFKYSASYRELRAIHFEDAKHYLEVMDLNAKPEKHDSPDVVAQLDEYLKNLDSRYPALSNPIAYEIGQKISDYLQYQDIKDERLFYTVSINSGKVAVMPQSSHHCSLNIVKLADAFAPLWEFMQGYEVRHRANHLRKLPLRRLPNQ
ncbi:KilA-N domain-containing protein [Acinetobacter baumannii]|uniref:KilA-N domain-containing protein n=1 Tax=Acinetobacter baumannii TaxID=470 RepID=UPI000B0B2106|nr:KilA-N domain-containing protein [Acinetobacter baumannii]MDC4425382.1 KilA-N domain-containing protein [Acinetobacter baumannii]